MLHAVLWTHALIPMPMPARMPALQSAGPRGNVRCAAEAAVPAAVSLIAGSLGGAIGVGVAYPLDTLKTKAQSSAGSTMPSNPFALAAQIFRAEGVAGFYSGVSTTMLGQALIKGALFFVYGFARTFTTGLLGATTLALCLAAAFSGAVSSLVMCPVERVKCVMQARPAGAFANPLACIAELVSRDGASGLIFRGLGATVAREMPACTFYLVGYELAKAALLASGALPRTAALLLSGAIAGAASWIPVYPIDVVKTQIQVELDGGGDETDSSFVGQARRLWRTGGFLAFWDGIGPKLARAVIKDRKSVV